ncbi:MAG: carotenoid oxygenase family protein [Pseudomonadota bacterium]
MEFDRRQFIGTGLSAGLLNACDLPATAAIETNQPPWHAGYRTAPDAGFPESPMQLVEGTPPAGLNGTLYRNGPAQFHYGNAHASHWFDGDGMIQRVHFDDGQAVHSGKFVETPKRTSEQNEGRFLADGFGTKGDPSYPVQSSDDVNAANTSVIMAGGELLALWEAGSPWRLDPETLESRGPKIWRDDLEGMPYLAHPKVEPDGRIWNLGVNATRIAIYLSDPNGELLDFGMADMGVPAYVHDWAMTDRQLIILVQPWIRTRFLPPFANSLEWRPEDGLKILIVDKDDFSNTRWAQGPARAFFHTGAAWQEDDGTIKLDVAFYDEPILGAGGGASEIAGTWTVAERPPYQSKFSLLVIPPRGDAHIIETALDGDFPQVDPRRHGHKRRLSALVTGVTDQHPGNTTLSVHDWETGQTDAFDFGSTRMVEEFLFVPKPVGSTERDSWLVGPVLNIARQIREIHVFDAGHISDGPVCTWMANYTWPLGFHGTWA